MSQTPTRPSILVVDDTPANLRLLFQILSETYDVRAVNSGTRALDSVRAAPPDLILLDIMMPDMSGYEVCTRLKADAATRDIPVLFISTLDGTDDKVRAFEAGGVDYVTKPLQVPEVLARVQTHLALRRLQEQLRQANGALELRVQQRTAELERLNAALTRFVPREFLDFLRRPTLAEVELGDQVQRTMTVLFSDIRDFTERSERLGPQATFEFVNAHLSRIGPIIRQHRGFIDNYVGDGVMALFPGAPGAALAAAVEMQRAVNRYNQLERPAGEPALRIGIGLHTGPLMLGIVGEAQRLQSTVISAAVNLANRLESLTKLYSASILISEQTLLALEAQQWSGVRFLDRVQVKGFAAPVSVFEVFEGEPEPQRSLKLDTCQDLEAVLSLYYARDFEQAALQLEKLLARNPADRLVQIYRSRAAHYAVHGAPEIWNGVSSV